MKRSLAKCSKEFDNSCPYNIRFIHGFSRSDKDEENEFARFDKCSDFLRLTTKPSDRQYYQSSSANQICPGFAKHDPTVTEFLYDELIKPSKRVIDKTKLQVQLKKCLRSLFE